MLFYRYLLRKFLPVFGFALAVLTCVGFMGQFVRVFNLALIKGISPVWILECFVLILPYFLSITFPVAFLVSFMITMGMLSETGEMMGLRAAGFSPREILAPFLASAILLSLLLLEVNHRTAPSGWNTFKNSYSAAASRVASVDPEPRTFITLGSWKLFSERVDTNIKSLDDVHLFYYRQESMVMSVAAARGRYLLEKGRGLQLDLFDGELVRPSQDDPSRIVRAKFGEYTVFVPFGPEADVQREPLPSEMTSRSIRSRLEKELVPEMRWELATEIASRSAAALSPLAFFMVAAPFGMRLERKGRAVGMAWSLLILFIYYGLEVLGISLGRKGPLLAETAPWIADAGCAFSASILAWRWRRGPRR